MGTHVLIALENELFPYDRRVRQEAEALTAAGHAVTVVGPTGLGHEPSQEDVDGVHALRYRAPAGGSGVGGYAHEYGLSPAHIAQPMWKAHRRRRSSRAAGRRAPRGGVGRAPRRRRHRHERHGGRGRPPRGTRPMRAERLDPLSDSRRQTVIDGARSASVFRHPARLALAGHRYAHLADRPPKPGGLVERAVAAAIRRGPPRTGRAIGTAPYRDVG